MLSTLKFDHLGIACKNLEKDLAYYLKMGYSQCSKVVVDSDIGVRVVFLCSPLQPMLELVEDIEKGKGPMSAHLTVNRRIFHIAYLTNDINSDVNHLVEGFGAALIVPVCVGKTYDLMASLTLQNRVIIELVQGPKFETCN